MKKVVLLAFVSTFLVNCVSIKALFQPIPYYPITFDNSKDIYPAVIAGFNQHGVKIKKMNILTNEYMSDYSIVNNYYKIQMDVFPIKDTLHTRVNKVLTYYEAEKKWSESILSAGLSENQFGSKFLNTVKQVLDNDSLYSKIKDNLLNSFDFNFTIMENMTEVAREKWINENLKNRTYSWELNMDEFEHNKSEIFQNYKYTARFHYTVNEGTFLLSDKIYLRLYTNDASLAKYSLNSTVQASGKLKELTRDVLGMNYYFYLVDDK